MRQSTYTGEWINDEKNGQGTSTYFSDDVVRTYTGEWKDGEKHGQGTDTRVHKTLLFTITYTGAFQNGERHGQGKDTQKNRFHTSTLTGEWINGLKNGIFTYTSDVTGTRQVMLKNDELVP